MVYVKIDVPETRVRRPAYRAPAVLATQHVFVLVWAQAVLSLKPRCTGACGLSRVRLSSSRPVFFRVRGIVSTGVRRVTSRVLPLVLPLLPPEMVSVGLPPFSVLFHPASVVGLSVRTDTQFAVRVPPVLSGLPTVKLSERLGFAALRTRLGALGACAPAHAARRFTRLCPRLHSLHWPIRRPVRLLVT